MRSSVANINWELAGITIQGGNLGRPISTEPLLVPARLILEDEWLLYVHGPGSRKVRPDAPMLNEFVQLGQADSDAILAFAKRWGVLRVCEEHLLPQGHESVSRVTSACSTLGGMDGEWYHGYEPVYVWQLLARQARALLDIASAVHQGKVASHEDWSPIFENPVVCELPAIDETPRRQATSLRDERARVRSVVNEWLYTGGVVPALEWRRETPDVELQSNGLFGALAIQLLMAIGRTEKLFICTSCGVPYVPKRRPARGRRHYCENCGRRAAVRDANAALRRRRRDKDRREGGNTSD